VLRYEGLGRFYASAVLESPTDDLRRHAFLIAKKNRSLLSPRMVVWLVLIVLICP